MTTSGLAWRPRRARIYSARLMGTDKRERQRANKAAKQAVASKEARRAKTIKRIKTLAIYAVVFAFVIFLAIVVFADGDEQALSSSVRL